MASTRYQVSPVRRPPVPENGYPRQDVDASWAATKMILNRTRHMFICRTTSTDASNRNDTERIKTIFRKSQKEHETRHWLGTSCDLWADYTECFEEIVVHLQEQYQFPDVAAASDRNFTTLILTHFDALTEDLDRLNDLLLLARNLLAGSSMAQDNAVLEDFHQQIYQLMQICVEFNIQGFDGEAGSADEMHFGDVINRSKTLLATCLQFIHNLVTKNDGLKMRVWLDLLCENTDVFNEEEELEPGQQILGDDGNGMVAISRAQMLESDVQAAVHRLLGPFVTETSASSLCSAISFWISNGIDLTLNKMHKIGLVSSAKISTNVRQDKNQRLKNGQNYGHRFSRPVSILKALGRITTAKNELVAPLDTDRSIMDNVEWSVSDSEDPDDPDDAANGVNEDLTFQKEIPASPYTLSEIPIILAPQEIEALPLMLQGCVLSTPDIMALDEQRRIEQAVRCHLLLRMSTGRMLLRELYIFIAAWDLPEDELFFKAMVNITNSFLQHSLLPAAYDALADPKDIVSPAQAVLVKLILHIFKTEIDPPERYRTRSPVHRTLDLEFIRFLLYTFRTNILPKSLAIIWMQGMVRDQVATPEEFEKANLNLWDMERTYEGVYQFLELFSALNDNPLWKVECITGEVAWDIVQLIRYLHQYIPIQPFMPAPPPPPPPPLPYQQQQQQQQQYQQPSSLDTPLPNRPRSSPAQGTTTNTTTNPTHPDTINSATTALPPPTTITTTTTNPPTTGPTPKPPLSVERPYSPNAPSPTFLPPPSPLHPQPYPPNPHQQSSSTQPQLQPHPPPPLPHTSTAQTQASAPAPYPPSPSPSPTNTPTPPHLYPWRNLKKMCILVLSGLLYNTPVLRAKIREYDGVLLIASCGEYDGHNPYIKEHAVLCLKLLLEGDRENQRVVEEGRGPDVGFRRDRERERERGRKGVHLGARGSGMRGGNLGGRGGSGGNVGRGAVGDSMAAVAASVMGMEMGMGMGVPMGGQVGEVEDGIEGETEGGEEGVGMDDRFGRGGEGLEVVEGVSGEGEGGLGETY